MKRKVHRYSKAFKEERGTKSTFQTFHQPRGTDRDFLKLKGAKQFFCGVLDTAQNFNT